MKLASVRRQEPWSMCGSMWLWENQGNPTIPLGNSSDFRRDFKISETIIATKSAFTFKFLSTPVKCLPVLQSGKFKWKVWDASGESRMHSTKSVCTYSLLSLKSSTWHPNSWKKSASLLCQRAWRSIVHKGKQKKTESHIFVRENHLTLAEQGTSRRQHAHSDMPNVAPIIQKATVLPGIRVKTAGIQEIRHSILKPADR